MDYPQTLAIGERVCGHVVARHDAAAAEASNREREKSIMRASVGPNQEDYMRGGVPLDLGGGTPVPMPRLGSEDSGDQSAGGKGGGASGGGNLRRTQSAHTSALRANLAGGTWAPSAANPHTSSPAGAGGEGG